MNAVIFMKIQIFTLTSWNGFRYAVFFSSAVHFLKLMCTYDKLFEIKNKAHTTIRSECEQCMP